MSVKQENVDKVYNHHIALETRTLFITDTFQGDIGETNDQGDGEINSKTADAILKGLHILESKSEDPITIVVNNTGGCEYPAIAIYDAIKSSRCHVTIRVLGCAMSAASIILQAADERIVSPNSRVMIHYGTWGHYDHPHIVQRWIEEGKRIDKWMEDAYLERIKEKKPKFSRKKLSEMLKFDTILNAVEAVELGLADKVE